MSDKLAAAVDAVVQSVSRGPVSGEGRVPGVVAGVTDRDSDIYLGASGVRDLSSGAAMTTDSVFNIWSTTKAITGAACLQLVESGDLDLQAPAKEYAPALADVQVIEGFDADGQPVLRAPASDLTTHHLLTHTAGFGYDFFNETYLRLAQEHGQPSVATASRAALRTPLLFDPGTRWEYGSNIDWAGQVVEGITGKRLGEVCQERIFEPLGMTCSTFAPSEEMLARKVRHHQREEDGTLTPSDFAAPIEPEVDFGGHGLFSTVPDYLRFIRMWLNEGRNGAGEQVLSPASVDLGFRNQLPDHLRVTMLPGVIKALSNDAEFFPGLEKTWSYTFQYTQDPFPTGRPTGAIGWAGLANLYYWIDRDNGFGGYWATQILPFADGPAFTGFVDFETAAYDAVAKG
ncbi:serine hydrolase domain-containing protein [Nocardioides daeguensis]|uniref:Serine hydrolase domain-containing protein n=1 Tax=Nocardioides daeguensis TaxID=908359 RepID=A0ABP6UUY9_9ACTN|nr:serine hydrolase domain-containing protein [Nocardioides daeguensis]MBV6725553.1 beta-lactamase family protein [Nocardioides daeguensis]MCR1771413.1 beta-lactamase family protein [Nocardioides daeguensis]